VPCRVYELGSMGRAGPLAKVFFAALLLIMPRGVAFAADSVSEYLRDGWDIKAASQISAVGYTQIILQKGTQGVVCTIHYSVTDHGWTGEGCDPLP
jgi:hypothetical protein